MHDSAKKWRANDAERFDDPIELLRFLISPWLLTLFNYDIQTLMQNKMCDLRKLTRPLYYKLRNNDSIVETFYIGMGDSPNKKPEGGKKAWFKRRKIRSIRGILNSPHLSLLTLF